MNLFGVWMTVLYLFCSVNGMKALKTLENQQISTIGEQRVAKIPAFEFFEGDKSHIQLSPVSTLPPGFSWRTTGSYQQRMWISLFNLVLRVENGVLFNVWRSTLVIFNITGVSTTVKPRIVGSYHNNHWASMVLPDGDLTYFATNGGIDILNTTDLTRPIKISSMPSLNVGGMALNEGRDLLYFASSNGLEIFNISDKNKPFQVTQFHGTKNETSNVTLLERCYRVSLYNDSFVSLACDTACFLLDITNTSNIEIIHQMKDSEIVMNCQLRDDVLFMVTKQELKLYNVSDLNDTELLYFKDITGNELRDLVIRDSTNFFVADYGKLRIYDWSDASNVIEKQLISIGAGTHSVSFCERTKMMFINRKAWIYAYNITSVDSISLICKRKSSWGFTVEHITSPSPDSDRLYLTISGRGSGGTGTCGQQGAVVIVDISDLDDLRLSDFFAIDDYLCPASCYVRPDESFAAVATTEKTVGNTRMVNIDLREIKTLGNSFRSSMINLGFEDDGYLQAGHTSPIVGDPTTKTLYFPGGSGLEVGDVADFENPIDRGDFFTTECGSTYSYEGRGEIGKDHKYLYFTCRRDAMIVNIENPGSPFLTTEAFTTGLNDDFVGFVPLEHIKDQRYGYAIVEKEYTTSNFDAVQLYNLTNVSQVEKLKEFSILESKLNDDRVYPHEAKKMTSRDGSQHFLAVSSKWRDKTTTEYTYGARVYDITDGTNKFTFQDAMYPTSSLYDQHYASYGIHVKKNWIFTPAFGNGMNVYFFGDLEIEIDPVPESCGTHQIVVKAEDDSGSAKISFNVSVHLVGFHDPLCTVFECGGVLSNSTEVCFKKGKCVLDKVLLDGPVGRCECTGENYDPNHFCGKCSRGYYGDDCGTVMCGGVFSNASNVCSGNGDCLPIDYGSGNVEGLCVCNDKHDPFQRFVNHTNCTECVDGVFGKSCNIFECYGVLSNQTFFHRFNVSCNTSLGWVGGNLTNITNCTTLLNETSRPPYVCSGHGNCDSGENPHEMVCSCSYGWGDDNCNVTTCFGVLPKDQNVCSNGGGKCVGLDECECYVNRYGKRCNISFCFGEWSNVTDNCGENGVCVNLDTCKCNERWRGKKCNVTKCFGILSNDTTSRYCSGHGTCSAPDHCDCENDYFGEICNITVCFGVLQNTSTTCSSRGNCVNPNKCECFPNYYGESCNVSSCYGILSNTSESCGDFGACVDTNKCECLPNYFGEFCNITTCFGIMSNITTGPGPNRVCRGHGICKTLDFCSCTNDLLYPFADCGFFCFNIPYNDTSSRVCTNHGNCIDHNVCDCDIHYNGTYSNFDNKDCSVWECHGILNAFGIVKRVVNGNAYPDPTRSVCSGHGTCLAYQKCMCNNHYNTTKNCDEWFCGEFTNSEKGRCSGHGYCVDHETCECQSQSYGGKNCAKWKCFNLTVGEDSNICGGHGTCKDVNECVCQNEYEDSVDGRSKCNTWKCYGNFMFDTLNVCGGRGICEEPDRCECGDFEGKICQTWSCGEEYTSPETCSGRGVCDGPNDCDCDTGFAGDICEENLMYETVMAPVLSVSGFGAICVVVSGVVVCIFCCVCVCCLCVCCWTLFLCLCVFFLSCTCLLLGGAGLGVLVQKLRLKKFGRLKNVDILLQEQQMEDDISIAHIRINEKLFEIDIKEIRVVKILGEGGSNSVVYLAEWNKQNVAFKCFKTRLICSSQNNFNEFEREVGVFSSIAHPNIVRFFGCTMDPPRVGILMEFCEKGECLQFILDFEQEKNGTLRYPTTERIRMLREIASSMQYLHNRDIIHRDLKCENVLLDEKECCKLMDFGLAKISRNLSQQTKKVGTSFFMAPEVCTGEGSYNTKCDVFSFAIMVFMLIVSEIDPYSSLTDDAFNIEMRVANDAEFRPSLEEMKKVLEEKEYFLCEIAQDCWKHEPSDRPSFQQVIDRIDLYSSSPEEEMNKNIGEKKPLQKTIVEIHKEEGEEEIEGVLVGNEREKYLVEIENLKNELERYRKKCKEYESLISKKVEE